MSTWRWFLARRASRSTDLGAEEGVDPVEGAVATPLVEVAPDGASWREVLGEVPPLAAGPQEVEDGIDDVAEGGLAGRPRPGNRQWRLEQRPLASVSRWVGLCSHTHSTHPLHLMDSHLVSRLRRPAPNTLSPETLCEEQAVAVLEAAAFATPSDLPLPRFNVNSPPQSPAILHVQRVLPAAQRPFCFVLLSKYPILPRSSHDHLDILSFVSSTNSPCPS